MTDVKCVCVYENQQQNNQSCFTKHEMIVGRKKN